MTTDTKLNQLIINKLTQEQYDEAKAAGTLSDTELYITDSDDEALTNNKISNCITEIPQDIKLELNNGTLTLKAGSKVYIPNGSGVFDVLNIQSDQTVYCSSTTGKTFIRVYTNQQSYADLPVSRFYSGSDPSGISGMFYNTTINKIAYHNNGVSDGNICSLPLAEITVNNGQVTSIDQVFNGFGYIGSTVYALPGVKGLIPNGRNADGSLKSIEFVNDRVNTFTASGSGYGLTYFLTPDYVTNLAVVNSKSYVEKDTKLTTFDNNQGVWFDTKQNIMLQTTDSGTTWTRVNYVSLSYMFMTNAGHLDYLVSKTVFHALDYNDKSTISGWSMPSSRYINLTLGADGTTYVAPANGWFQIWKLAGRVEAYFNFVNKTNNTAINSNTSKPEYSSRMILPVRKGDVIECTYNSTGSTNVFRFIYAEGEN